LSTSKYYITASAIVSNHTVVKNQQQLYVDDGIDNAPAFFLSVYQHFGFNYPKFYKMDNLSKLGWLTAEELLKDSFDKDRYQPDQTGVILANANSSLDADLRYFESIADVPSPALFVYTLPNIVIGEICIRHGFKGENAFYIQEQFDADFIVGQVSYLLDQNLLQACICGWVDVLKENYKAGLFLIEKEQKENSIDFSAINLNCLLEGKQI
jgi:hypothetical protein